MARGQLCEILMVIDTSLWRSPVGDTLRTVFASPYPGLPQDEPHFNLRIVNPLGLNGLLKNAKNMIFVSTLDNRGKGNRSILANFTANSIEMIKKDSSNFTFMKKDDFAKGQFVLHLFGANSEELIANLVKNRESLRNAFMKIEKDRLAAALFGSEQKTLMAETESQFGFTFRIPSGYKVADKKDDFLWLRHPEREVDRNIFIAQKAYTSEQAFLGDSILAWRQQIAGKYLFGDPERPQSFITIQKVIPPTHQVITLNEQYSVETRGLWQTNNLSMGGAFISYVLVDKAAQKMIYLEGFVYAPGKDKRDYMLEMETILKTFKEKQ